MKPISTLLFVTLIVATMGCNRTPPTTEVCVVDVSQSIKPEGLNLEFEAVSALIDTMRRGDRLVVVPITGDAANDTAGHVLAFAVPLTRQPYDHDLQVFRKTAHQRLNAMRQVFATAPTTRTDILGALDIAAEQSDLDRRNPQAGKDGNATLLVFSDFLEDDGTLCFASEKRLNSTHEAVALGRQLGQAGEHSAFGEIRLIILPSNSAELTKMSKIRAQNLRALWTAYFTPIKPRWGLLD